ncbi:ankyrin repeat-containing protein ITN1 [Hevea brasiliensis]|uniref:ankyrin repeat-containing protein ITN1 n=1 Tax=Hevea brasiliensis TaxID=3981 RepID=UPI0025D1B803|nr:ankyrin repeat-containing protein ITN1 [Hevea brasiliensis]
MLSSQEPNDEENGQGSHKLEPNHGKIKRNQVPKSIKVLKLRHAQVLQLLKVIFKEIATLSEEQLKNIGLNQVIYDAIKRGSFEFINELITCNPVIIWRGDKKGRTLFAHAITLRQEKIFNLIYRFGSRRRILIMLDVFNNNYLHLAAKLSPSFQLDQVPGAALQMQWELQWFKHLDVSVVAFTNRPVQKALLDPSYAWPERGIESMLPPKFGERLNENFLTPSALFTKEHKELVKEGERWMKNNTASCMVVAALIATVMFTTAFTVPGGNDQTGFPIFLGYDAFLVFIVSNALSLFSSSTSVLIFLGILTARFAEDDFLKSLPNKLILGLFTLFFSVVTMMIAFGSTIFILLQKRLSWIAIPITVLSIIPIFFFVVYQFPVLIRMVIHTHKSSFFDKPNES